MFYDYDKKAKRIIAVIIVIISYILITGFLSLNKITEGNSIASGVLVGITHLWYVKIPLAMLIAFLLVYLKNDSLDIEAKKVGHGQHGSATFMNREEISEVYKRIPFGQEKIPGILAGHDNASWLIDDSDHNLLLLAPPGGGKTKRIYIPSIYYNAQVNKNYLKSKDTNPENKGASMVIMDIKGELYRSCKDFLIDCGYETPVLNFRDIALSDHYQLMYKVNKAIDRYKSATSEGEKAVYYGYAERYAKILASSLVDNTDGGTGRAINDASEYFSDTGKGLLTGIILLVSEYAAQEERHIISVFSLILETNGVLESTQFKNNPEQQKSRLVALLDKLDNKRIKYYTGATTSADSRTLMNIFSSALSKLIRFIDAELEQAICDHSERLNDIDFINKPTAIFLICPDENTTRHFFASLFLRYFSNDLIEQAEEEHNGILPRKVIFFCDEFGNLPPINDVDVLFSAIRGRGVRIAISLQSYNQLYKSYSKEKAEIIKDTCQMVMSGFVAPSSHDTAKTLSEMLGNETVMTGSVNRGDKTSTTTSMIGKPLLSISEWVTLPHGTYILQKGGYNPLKTEMKLFFNYLPNIRVAEQESVPPLEYTEIQVTDSRKLQMYAHRLYSPIKKGMFD